MELDSAQKKLIELFVEQENLIRTLYKLFAKRYPEYEDFWTEMSIEEYQHAALIQRITESDSKNEVKFSQGALRSSSLVSSIKYIEDIISEFKGDKDFTVDKAANIALILENALWERKVFQYFDGDSDEVKKIMNSLNSEQVVHIKKLKAFVSQLKMHSF